jgi:uncharacterized protein (TIGR02569 family)
MPEGLRFGPEEVTESGVRLMGDAGWQWRAEGPTPEAVRALGVRGEDLRRLPGGAGFVWTDGRLVIKPVGCVPEHDWVCGVFAEWGSDDVRVPEPVHARGVESWSAAGWGAHVFLAGRDAELLEELDLVREAGDAFHEAVRDLARPGFMDDRDDPWAYGDRLAWEDVAPEADEETAEVICELLRARRPVTATSQVVHGDLLPNVLAGDGMAPGIIDWPPYFRPAAFASAIAVHDALAFRGAPLTLLEEWETGPDWGQVMLRAALYRLGPTGIFATRNRLMGGLRTHVARVRPLVAEILARVG